MKTLKINKTQKANTDKILSYFQMLELVAQSQEPFDPRESFNQKDGNYNFMMRFFDVQNCKFNYHDFLADVMNTIGADFVNVMMGYEALVEKYCDPDNKLLALKNNVVLLEEREVVVKASFLAEYNSFGEWLKDQSRWITKYGVNSKILSLDCDNMIITGYVMKHSKNNVFPVKVYLAERSVELPLPYRTVVHN